MRAIALCLLSCVACSTDDSPPGDGGPDGSCEPAEQTIDLATGHGWSLHGMTSDERGPWVVVEKRRDGTSSLVIAEPSGEGATLIGGLTETSGMDLAPVIVDGKRCIAMHLFDEQFRFACEDGTLEMPDLELGGRLAAVQAPSGSVHVFGQDFAAYHELRRVAGTWREVEKFESSISRAEDAVVFGGSVASCFVSTGGFPSIDLADDIVYGSERAAWCRLIPGSELGVLTDLGLTTFANRRLGSWQPSALGAQRPLALGRTADAPFAIVQYVDDRVERQPLPAGEPTVLRTLSGAENAHAAVRGDRVFVMSVKPLFEPTGTRYQLVSTTHCVQ